MQNPAPIKLLFVINPVSGGKVKHDWEAAVREFFVNRPEAIEFYLLTGNNDKVSLRYYIENLKPDRVVAIGGDGTVKLVAEMVKETKIPMGIIPAGSANGMAKELDIPPTIQEALEIIVNGQIKKIDMIRINEEELCIHLSDIGLNAMLVRYFESSEKRGMRSYAKALLRVLWEKQKMRVTITTDGGTIKRKAYMVALANARKYGTGANINPEGDITDGKFEVVVVRKINVFEIIKSIFSDRSFHPRRVEIFSTTNLDLAVHHKAYFQVDGEYMGRTTSLKARILPQILNVIVPVQPPKLA